MYKFLLNALPILIPAMNPSKSYLDSVSDSPFDPDDLEAGPTASHPGSTLEVPLAKRTARLSLSTQAQLVFLRKRTRRWHAALAGALASGVAIMWEKRSRRSIIAQQLFVRWVHFSCNLKYWLLCTIFHRGLQGSYNSYTTKRNIRVPHGEVIVFALSYVTTAFVG